MSNTWNWPFFSPFLLTSLASYVWILTLSFNVKLYFLWLREPSSFCEHGCFYYLRPFEGVFDLFLSYPASLGVSWKQPRSPGFAITTFFCTLRPEKCCHKFLYFHLKFSKMIYVLNIPSACVHFFLPEIREPSFYKSPLFSLTTHLQSVTKYDLF